MISWDPSQPCFWSVYNSLLEHTMQKYYPAFYVCCLWGCLLKLDPSSGKVSLAVFSLYEQTVLQLRLFLLCLLHICLSVVLSPFGCPLMHFSLSNQLLIYLVPFLVAARSLAGQLNCAEKDKGKGFRQSSFASLNKTYFGNPALLF